LGEPAHLGAELIELNAIEANVEAVFVEFDCLVNEDLFGLDRIEPEALAFTLDLERFIEMNQLTFLLVAMVRLDLKNHLAGELCLQLELE
jgi:hypothetical protein